MVFFSLLPKTKIGISAAIINLELSFSFFILPSYFTVILYSSTPFHPLSLFFCLLYLNIWMRFVLTTNYCSVFLSLYLPNFSSVYYSLYDNNSQADEELHFP